MLYTPLPSNYNNHLTLTELTVYQIPVLLLISSVILDEFCNPSVPVNIKYNSKYISQNGGEGSVTYYMFSS